MTRPLLIALLFITLVSCQSAPVEKLERKNEPTIYGVEQDDPEMIQAINIARKTFPDFESALKSNKSNYNSFALKLAFDSPNGKEHIWMGNIFLKNNKYFGIVFNDPQWATQVQFGDTLEINTANISDWKYLEGDKLHGGYSIRLLRDRMSYEERASFDRESGMIIE